MPEPLLTFKDGGIPGILGTNHSLRLTNKNALVLLGATNGLLQTNIILKAGVVTNSYLGALTPTIVAPG